MYVNFFLEGPQALPVLLRECDTLGTLLHRKTKRPPCKALLPSIPIHSQIETLSLLLCLLFTGNGIQCWGVVEWPFGRYFPRLFLPQQVL